MCRYCIDRGFAKVASFVPVCAFLVFPCAASTRIAEDEAVKNDQADSILRQEHLPTDYGIQLLGEFDSPDESTIWKNYILQKLDVLYLHPDSTDLRTVILTRLWKESRSPTPTFAGTSLMTLLRLHEVKPEIVSSSKLTDRCEWVIGRPAYSNSDRLSALNVLSSLDQEHAAVYAREWLEDEKSPPMLQMTAIAVLGKAPTPSDLSIIRPYLNHPDLRLRSAAQTALKQ
jgi:hypothetical protein